MFCPSCGAPVPEEPEGYRAILAAIVELYRKLPDPHPARPHLEKAVHAVLRAQGASMPEDRPTEPPPAAAAAAEPPDPHTAIGLGPDR